jgi:hypothetical protein
MDKQQPNYKTKFKKRSQQTPKKQLVGGTIIATLIAITPYLFYLHESIPDGKVWDTFLFSYESAYFEDVNYVMWIFTSKAIPLLLLFIWFFTNRHWWYHVILVPIAMYIYQIISLFNDDYSYYDAFPFFYLIPIMAIVIPSIYLIRAKMFNKLNTADKTMEELEQEFKIKPTSFRDYF